MDEAGGLSTGQAEAGAGSGTAAPPGEAAFADQDAPIWKRGGAMEWRVAALLEGVVLFFSFFRAPLAGERKKNNNEKRQERKGAGPNLAGCTHTDRHTDGCGRTLGALVGEVRGPARTTARARKKFGVWCCVHAAAACFVIIRPTPPVRALASRE